MQHDRRVLAGELLALLLAQPLLARSAAASSPNSASSSAGVTVHSAVRGDRRTIRELQKQGEVPSAKGSRALPDEQTRKETRLQAKTYGKPVPEERSVQAIQMTLTLSGIRHILSIGIKGRYRPRGTAIPPCGYREPKQLSTHPCNSSLNWRLRRGAVYSS